jgi:hypothetical protein
MSLPLLALDKNDAMMKILLQCDWFVEYRKQLAAFRRRADAYRQDRGPLPGPAPVCPSDRVQGVEDVVDLLRGKPGGIYPLGGT